MKAEPKHDSHIITARLNEKSYYPGKKSLQPMLSQKSWVTSQKIFFLTLVSVGKRKLQPSDLPLYNKYE